MTNLIPLMVIELEILLDDEPRCESAHSMPGNETCLGDVVALTISTHLRKFSCAASAAFFQRAIDNPDERCRQCHEPCATHWRVVPI